ALDRLRPQADAQPHQARERRGGASARISDRLSERIAQSERRSAQALDDIGRRLSESTDKMHQRHERASGDLAERMRQSEERTARLLADARDSMEQRADRDVRRAPPLESPDPVPWTPAETAGGDWRATAFADPIDDWSAEPLDAGPTRAPFGRIADDAWPHAAPAAASSADEDLFGGADVSDILNAAADLDAERPLELDRLGDDDGFSADLDFVSPHASAQ